MKSIAMILINDAQRRTDAMQMQNAPAQNAVVQNAQAAVPPVPVQNNAFKRSDR